MDLGAAFGRIEGLELEAIRGSGGIRARRGGPHPGLIQEVSLRYGSISFGLMVKLEESPDARGLSDRLDALKRRTPRGAVPMLAAPYIGPTLRRRLEQAGVAWVDSLGNIHIQRDRPPSLLHIEARGTRASLPRFRGRLFSPAHGRVARALLERPDDIHRLRDLATVADTDVSSVSRAMKVFVEANLVERLPNGWHIPDPRALLDAWLDRTLSEPGSRSERWYLSSAAADDLMDRLGQIAQEEDLRVAFTGGQAANALGEMSDGASAPVEAYVDPFDRVHDLAKLLGLTAASPIHGNIHLVESRHGGPFVGVDARAARPVVGRVQLITDLYRSGREGEEIAQLLRSRWSI